MSPLAPARASAAWMSFFWAWPLGAVNEADLPSQRTAVPGTVTAVFSTEARSRTAAPQLSARA
eukprot:scaffold250610_cov30-Tisochrysis_lutea.AAC.14